jgi:ElaB/YqjD/DUF883 family membrane-anchored ribosome-binding protein
VSFTRNDVWRIKRSAQQLNKALDSLTRANGELRPKQFDKLREELQGVINDTEAVFIEMEKIVQATTKAAPRLDLDLDDDEKEAAE